MRFKYNPWVSIVAVILLAAILVLTCTGCVTETEAATPTRLTTEWAGFVPTGGQLVIITDTETGVQYLLAAVNEGTALIKLEG